MSVSCPHCGRVGPRTGPACGHCGQSWGQGPSEWRTTVERVGLPPAAVDTAEQPIFRPKTPAPGQGGSQVIWVATALVTLAASLLIYWFVRQTGAVSPAPVAAAIAPVFAAHRSPADLAAVNADAPAADAPAADAPAADAPAAARPSPDVDWPPRLEEKALWLAFEAALAQGSVRGALDGIQCTPRPCVVFGRLADGVDAVRLLDAPQLSAYTDDRRFIYRWTERATEVDGRSHLGAHFALAFIPKNLDATTRADLERSVSQRTAQRRAAGRAADGAADGAATGTPGPAGLSGEPTDNTRP